MDDLKIRIHPLFYIFGLYFTLTGKVFSFLVFTFTAVIHELGHFFASNSLGYKLNRISLMPYGAIISGNDLVLKYKDELKISLAGPLINLLIGTAFISLWWFIPEIYPYTELVVIANYGLFTINLLPAYPLDGGRFLQATLSLFLPRKTALLIVRILGVITASLLLLLFVYSIFTAINFTILFFALFMFFGSLDTSKKNAYVRVFDSLISLDYSKPLIVKKYLINGNALIKSLYPLLDHNYYVIIEVLLNNKKSYTLEGEKLLKLLTSSSLYSSVNNAIKNL